MALMRTLKEPGKEQENDKNELLRLIVEFAIASDG